jgi:hypothetical protein
MALSIGVYERNLVRTASATCHSPINGDPQLVPLANNGGQTRTLLPAYTAPVVDQGDASASLPTDQRGVPRPQGSAVDLGAVELQPPRVLLPRVSRAETLGIAGPPAP